jgi:hypothetical protein
MMPMKKIDVAAIEAERGSLCLEQTGCLAGGLA